LARWSLDQSKEKPTGMHARGTQDTADAELISESGSPAQRRRLAPAAVGRTSWGGV